jgi:nucleoside-diphosphate-sugar epimerase
VYGPANNNPNHVYFFDRLRLGRPIVLPGDGEYVLDFVHVEDCAREFVLALTNPRAVGRAYNSTDGRAYTQRSFVQQLSRITGLPAYLVPVPRDRYNSVTGVHRPGQVRRGFFGGNLDYMQHICHSPARAIAELGWSFRPSEEGFRQTYAWYLASDWAHATPDFSLDDRLLAR